MNPANTNKKKLFKRTGKLGIYNIYLLQLPDDIIKEFKYLNLISV